MTPCEILKEMRQKEITASQLSRVLSPVFELFGVATCVKDRRDDNACCLDHVMNYERKTAQEPQHGGLLRALSGSVQGYQRCVEDIPQLQHEIPCPSLRDAFHTTQWTYQIPAQRPGGEKSRVSFAVFASSFAFNPSIEMTSSGLSRCSCKRLSINSASPGVSSFDSTISSQRLRQSSICSASGRARASFKTVSEVMTLNLPASGPFASP